MVLLQNKEEEGECQKNAKKEDEFAFAMQHKTHLMSIYK
jgi:hypothetical protein